MPGVALTLAVLLFIFTEHVVWRSIAILIVAGPALYFLTFQANRWIEGYLYRQEERGSGHFSLLGSDRALRPLAEAVVKGDVEYLRKNAVGVDFNVASDRNVTLLEIAVREAKKQEYERHQPIDAQLAVINALLELGAKPATNYARRWTFVTPRC